MKNIISEIPKLLKKPRELSDSGFQRVDKKDTILIIDCGVPKNYHATYKAHSCSTTFELSYKKNHASAANIILDFLSGVCDEVNNYS